MNKKNKQIKPVREYSIGADIIRILSGFGVVLIHVTDPFIVYPPYEGVRGLSWLVLEITNTLFRFSVPLFVMLSGYLLLNPQKTYDFGQFYKKRFRKVGIPFIFWVVVYFFWLSWMGVTLTPYLIAQRVLSANLDFLYFLVIILEMYLVTPVLTTFLANTTRKAHTYLFLATIVFTVTIPLINLFFPKIKLQLASNALTIALPYLSYYIAGYYLKTIKLNTLVRYALWHIVPFVGFFGALLSNGVVSAYPKQYGSFFILIMCYSLFILVMQKEYRSRLWKSPVVQKLLQHISGTIFGIYIIHIFIISFFDLTKFGIPGNSPEPVWLVALLKSVVVFAVCYLVVSVGRKLPYLKVLFAS